MGMPVVLTDAEIEEGKRSMIKTGANLLASDKVSLERGIPDMRIRK